MRRCLGMQGPRTIPTHPVVGPHWMIYTRHAGPGTVTIPHDGPHPRPAMDYSHAARRARHGHDPARWAPHTLWRAAKRRDSTGNPIPTLCNSDVWAYAHVRFIFWTFSESPNASGVLPDTPVLGKPQIRYTSANRMV